MNRIRLDQIAVIAIIAFAGAMVLAWILPSRPPPVGDLSPSSPPPASVVLPADSGTGTVPTAPTGTPASVRPTTRPPVKAPPPTTRRAPRSTSPPPVRQTDPDVVPSYPNCHDLRLDHPEGVEVGHPAYRPAWDTDHDGWACDPDDPPLALSIQIPLR